MSKETTRSWGGSRPGSGRKATGVKPLERIALRVSIEVKDLIRQQAAAEGKTIKRLIEEMLFERIRTNPRTEGPEPRQ